MKRRYINFKKIHAWLWHRCEMCQRYFKKEEGWYGWYDRSTYNGSTRIKRYLCDTCCYSEDTADTFFAEYQWIPLPPASLPVPRRAPKNKAEEPNVGHSNSRYEIIKDQGTDGQQV